MKILILAFLAIMILFLPNAYGSWFNESYAKRTNFTINVTSTTIANIVNNVMVDIPINWDMATEVTQGQLNSNGTGLRIVSENNTELTWQWCEYDNPTYGVNTSNTCIFVKHMLTTSNTSIISFYYNYSQDRKFYNSTFNQTFSLRSDLKLLSLIYGGTNKTHIVDREEDTVLGGGIWTNTSNVTVANETGLKMTAINVSNNTLVGALYRSNTTDPYPNGSMSIFWWYKGITPPASSYLINDDLLGGPIQGFDIRVSVSGSALHSSNAVVTNTVGTFTTGTWFFGAMTSTTGTGTHKLSGFNDTKFLGRAVSGGSVNFAEGSVPELFGSTSASNFNFTGVLQILTIYNGTLTDDEINATWAVWSNNSLVSNKTEENRQNFGNCTNGTPKYKILSFVGKDEEGFGNLTQNFSMDISITNNFQSNSFHFEKNTAYDICADLTETSKNIDAIIDYDSLTIYPKRSYYLVNASIIPTTTNSSVSVINLYLLNTTYASKVTFTIQDNNGAPIEGYYAKLLRYSTSTNSYATVQISKSDYLGKAIVQARLYDAFYRIIVDDGINVKKTTTASKLDSDTKILTIDPQLAEYWQYFNQISYNCAYTNSSLTLQCTVNDLSNLMNSACLRINQIGTLTNTTIYDACTTGSGSIVIGNTWTSWSDLKDKIFSYQLYANINTNINNRIFLLNRILQLSQTLTIIGISGLILTAMIIFTVSAMGFWSPSLAVIFASLALGASTIMGLITVNMDAVAGLIFVGMIFAWRLRK